MLSLAFSLERYRQTIRLLSIAGDVTYITYPNGGITIKSSRATNAGPVLKKVHMRTEEAVLDKHGSRMIIISSPKILYNLNFRNIVMNLEKGQKGYKISLKAHSETII